jgi:SNF2 family DNA or RNA helicase
MVKGGIKIGLTGTPIENRLRELKTLFDLTLPGYMPPESDYLRFIVYPIERENNMERKGLLSRLIRPFVLRRMKKDVLKDLPEKTEELARCDFFEQQEKLYREVLIQQKDAIMQELSDSSKIVPYLHVFALLSKLKQICDHPALYYKKIEDYQHYHSGKWELFKELLSEARESGQKVVVYSQYLGMLDIIEMYLKEMGIGYASLRGSTRDRREQSRLFAEDPNCEVFVASLKAAGLGIDLTSASVVIHYDRWWNAAREDQATDRVHRFGQNRGVQVFKLMTKNSFEERIDQIIERKRVLMDESVGVDDQNVFKTLTREEIYDLLRIQ